MYNAILIHSSHRQFPDEVAEIVFQSAADKSWLFYRAMLTVAVKMLKRALFKA